MTSAMGWIEFSLGSVDVPLRIDHSPRRGWCVRYLEISRDTQDALTVFDGVRDSAGIRLRTLELRRGMVLRRSRDGEQRGRQQSENSCLNSLSHVCSFAF